MLLTLLATAMARGSSESDTPYIQVVGQSSLTVTPDMAVVSFTVTSTKPSAAAARDTGAELTNSTLNALSALNGLNQTTDVSTTNVNIQPQTVSSWHGTGMHYGIGRGLGPLVRLMGGELSRLTPLAPTWDLDLALSALHDLVADVQSADW